MSLLTILTISTKYVYNIIKSLSSKEKKDVFNHQMKEKTEFKHKKEANPIRIIKLIQNKKERTII